MDEFSERLNAVLNDPGQMQRIADMAKAFMGGGAAPEPESPPASAVPDLAGMLDPAMLQRLSGFLNMSGGRSDKHALLEAMKPYLSEKRRNKVDKAVQLARLATIAQIALRSFKEDGDV